LDQQAQKQQELIYNQDFQIQQLERKIRRIQGERTDEEQEALTKKIKELQDELDALTSRANLLNSQFKRSLDDQRHAKKLLGQLTSEMGALGQEIDELNLYNDSAVRSFHSSNLEPSAY
jgi:UDP-glucose:O-linked fucose beta-1,3-glucosyltransferase